MATTTEVQERAALNIRTASLMLGDLAEIAAEWDELGDGERVSWMMDWGNEMAGLSRLANYAAEDLLTQEQQQAYCALLARLRVALPTIQQLNLDPPPMLL